MDCNCNMKNMMDAMGQNSPHLHQIHCIGFVPNQPLRTVEQRIIGHLTYEEYNSLKMLLFAAAITAQHTDDVVHGDKAAVTAITNHYMALPQSLKDWIQ